MSSTKQNIINGLEISYYRTPLFSCASQFWSSCLGASHAKLIFSSWGATEVEQVADHGGYIRFMVRLPANEKTPLALWYYAHTNGGSCYVSLEYGYDAPDGATAWKMRACDNAPDSLIQAKRELETKSSALVEARAALLNR